LSELSESLDVWDPRPSAIALEKIFEIMLNLEIASVLFLINSYCLIYVGVRLCYSRKISLGLGFL
jgi:hypothetical protein